MARKANETEMGAILYTEIVKEKGLDVKGRHLDTERLFCLSSLPLDVTTPQDPYARYYIELVTLVTLSESLAEGGFDLLTSDECTRIFLPSFPDA